jgi:hypothetical protein
VHIGQKAEAGCIPQSVRLHTLAQETLTILNKSRQNETYVEIGWGDVAQNEVMNLRVP